MKRILTTLIVVFFIGNALSFGQLSEFYRTNATINVLDEYNIDPNVDGSPYIHANFNRIKINQFDVIYGGRFNAFTGDLEVMTDDSNNPIALDYTKPITVTFLDSNKTYKSFEYVDEDGEQKDGFLVEIIKAGDVSLLAKEYVKYHEKRLARTGYEKDKPARFERLSDAYFILTKDDKVIAVPRKSKNLTDLFADKHKEQIKDFIKKEKINTSDKNDLIKFTKYVSSLS